VKGLAPHVRARSPDVQSHNICSSGANLGFPILRRETRADRFAQHNHPFRRIFRFPIWEQTPLPVHFPVDLIPSFPIS